MEILYYIFSSKKYNSFFIMKGKIPNKNLFNIENYFGLISLIFLSVHIIGTIGVLTCENMLENKSNSFYLPKILLLLIETIFDQPFIHSIIVESISVISYLLFNLIYDKSVNTIFYLIATIISSFILFKQIQKNNFYKEKVLKLKITRMKLRKEILNTIEYPIIMLGISSGFLFQNQSYKKFNDGLNYKERNSKFFDLKDKEGNSLVQTIQSLIDDHDQEIIRKYELFKYEEKSSEKFTETQYMINLIKRKFNAFNEEGIVVVIKNIEHEIRIGILQRNIEFTNLMLYSISHEFRTPLNGINGVLQLLKSKVENQFYKHVHLGKSCLKLLNNQIDCLLDYAHIIKGEFSIHETLFNLKKLFITVKNISQKWMLDKKNQIEILILIPTDFPQKILGDYNRIKQILLNLIINSIKYTGHGFIKLSASFQNNGFVELNVEDSGSGFSETQIKTINSFNFDCANSIVIGYKSFPGFKLSIVHMLLFKMHSKLSAERRKIGSNLFFKIPQNQDLLLKNDKFKTNSLLDFDENINIPVYNKIENYNKIKFKHTMIELKCKRSKSYCNLNLKLKKILIVDDVESNRFILSEMIMRIKTFPILHASNGVEALNIAQIEHNYNNDLLIFMDVEMPVMDGLESTAQIRKFSVNPIIILTAYASEDIRNKSINVGANRFMTKPISFSQLKRILVDFDYI